MNIKLALCRIDTNEFILQNQVHTDLPLFCFVDYEPIYYKAEIKLT